MAITSQTRPRLAFGEFYGRGMEEGRAHRAFGGQARATTIERRLVLEKLGQLQPVDVSD